MPRKWGMGAALLALACLPGPPAKAMPLGEVLQRVLARHPDVALSRLDVQVAEADALGIEGQLDPSVTASLGFSDETTPLVSQFAPIGTTLLALKAGIRKPLAAGPSIGLEFDYRRSLQSYSSPFAAQLANPNPAYRHEINLSYRHPLLKGAGRPGYHQALAAAKADEQAAGVRQYVADEQLALKAVRQYYALAADRANLRLAAGAVKRAKRLLAYQRTLESLGLIEAADRLQAEALVATRELERRQAEEAVAQARAALNRLMLRDLDAPIEVELGPLPEAAPESLDAALAVARRRRPELLALDAALKAAEARLAAARDRARMQLDLVAKFGTRAVAASPGAAARQGLSINDRLIFLGLEFADTLRDRAAEGAIRKAELARRKVLLERRRAIERIKDELSAPLTALSQRRRIYLAAKARAAAEARKFEAEIERFRQGRSDTATVVQFENDLRAAEVQVTLQEFLLRLAHHELSWAKGTLYDELGLAWPDFAP